VAGNVPGGEFTPLGVGTGVIVDPAGYVLTNWHVVGGFQAAIVFLKPSAGSEPRKELGYWVRAVAYDSAKDLALLKMLRPPTGLPTVKLGDFSQIQVAQDIHVIGHPGGVEHAWTYTTGVVSQIRRSYEAQFSDQTIHADLLQIQTAINPGNSGGPVLDDQGRMIGLVSFGMPKMQNMNFAIAADEIAAFLSRSLAARTRGVPAPASEEPKATYLAARFEDGRQVIKAQYGDATVYVVRTQESKPIELVCKTNDGVVLQGLEPGLTGGFNKWLITMSDGTALEASGKAGLPEVFVGK
jgi:S1-C subfamily serine protease